MRPHIFSDSPSASIPSFESGLPQTSGMDYNHRQELPVEGPATRRLLPQVQRREAGMESSRPQSSSPGTLAQKSTASQEVRPETRAERLARIRREIEAGTYETREKMEIAIDRLFGAMVD